jgi:hypothetical protein
MAVKPEEGQQEASINAAIAEALEASDYDADAATNDWSGFDEETPDAPDASVEDTSSTAEPATTTDETPEGATTTGETPTSYWGVDLSDIPEERRAEVIAHFEQQDSTIRKLQERLSTPPEETPPPDDEEVVVEDVTDEDLLRAAGYDPEDMEVQRMSSYILPLLRTQLANEEKLDQLYRNEQVRTVQSTWNQQLDELEDQYGKLPVDRLSVLREAAEKKYATPFEAYHRIAAPVRKEVENAATAARREAARRASGASPRPTSTDGEEPPIKEGMSLRDAVAASAKAAQKETGFSWRDSVKNPFARSKS